MNRDFHPPRWLARIIAFAEGYFWKPCPRCGQMFAGWECGNGLIVTHTKRTRSGAPIMQKGFMCCWRCSDDKVDAPTVKHEIVDDSEGTDLSWLGGIF